MRYAVLEGDKVANVIVADAEFAASIGAVACPASVGPGWVYNGADFSPPPPVVKTPEEIQAEIVTATQARLDTFAQGRFYDDIKSASDYAGCSVPQFSIEGQYCKDKRAETWAKCYEILAEVQAGTRPVPTGYDDIEPDLPALVWPT